MTDRPLFADTQSAIMWAEEFASRPDCQSQIGKLLHKPNKLKLGREELRDLALTITGWVSAAPAPSPLVLRCLYGDRSKAHFLEVGSQAAHVLHASPHGPGKEIAKLRALAMAVTESERKRAMTGKPMSFRGIASLVGISSSAFINTVSWGELLDEAQRIIEGWAQKGLDHVTLQLDAAALLDRDYLANVD